MDTSGSKDFSMHASKKNTHKHIELDQIESSLRDSQKQLELEKTRLSLALDQMPAAIVIADQPTRRITNINRYCELIWKLSFKGNTIEEFDQTHQLFHLNGTPYKVEERPLARAIGETIVAEEAVFKRGDGSTGFLRVNAAPIVDDEGKVVGTIAVHSDITESKELQQKLEEYNKNLERKVEERTRKLQESERMAAIGLTASMVGHDLRNPLQAMENDVYLLKSELSTMLQPIKEDIKANLESIESNIGYINKIVTDLRDFSKPLKPDFVEINNLCYHIEQSLLTVKIPKEIQFKMNCSRDLPKVKLDLNLFKRILVNLVTNAIQAMPNGGTLTISALKDTKSVFVTVEDTGVGIPEQIKPTLFTPLITTKPQGQGLGLAVVKRLVEALNGTVNFESQTGKGTNFIIQLPLINSTT